MDPRRGSAPSDKHHGPHTLRIWRGTIVDSFGHDVFVELGPRMQGVIARRHFRKPPLPGQKYDFTLHGQEEGLWALSLKEEDTLETWEEMEEGSLVQARVVRLAPGGFEIKVGPLHAFMPKSHSGLARDEKPEPLVGKNLTVEVIEVDVERQRVVVSRKLVMQRERDSQHQREIAGLRVGQRVNGRVSRVESYGVFVSFGHGLEGLVHVSDLDHARVEDPLELVQPGQTIECVVLSVKNGGRRIALGRKQLVDSPWSTLETRCYVDQIVEGRVTHLVDFGAFVEIERGVEGLLHESECGLTAGVPLRTLLTPGQRVAVRIAALDPQAQRLSLSLQHKSGGRITAEEIENARHFAELLDKSPQERLELPLGKLLARALRDSLGKRNGRAQDGPTSLSA
ncbi:MAG: 30S ribosomal protein S1 [Planctomycetes bacterium]|nr:30S ribosomal protein S1 [Planctomycetota bacterium]